MQCVVDKTSSSGVFFFCIKSYHHLSKNFTYYFLQKEYNEYVRVCAYLLA